MVSLIYTEAFNLDFQFKNIFSAAKVEAGEIYLELSKANIPGLLDELIDSFKYECKKKKLTIKPLVHNEKLDFTFCTDAAKLRLILSNILSNAIKFSNEGGLIEIECFIGEENLKISVRDYGQGISQENKRNNFRSF
ncbi:MAG: sensor histidine kinase [Bacteroidales bacterium]|nr:sensor histidine kinase [Bacteroidales bacterium]